MVKKSEALDDNLPPCSQDFYEYWFEENPLAWARLWSFMQNTMRTKKPMTPTYSLTIPDIARAS